MKLDGSIVGIEVYIDDYMGMSPRAGESDHRFIERYKLAVHAKGRKDKERKIRALERIADALERRNTM